jgi:hypothetical protein
MKRRTWIYVVSITHPEICKYVKREHSYENIISTRTEYIAFQTPPIHVFVHQDVLPSVVVIGDKPEDIWMLAESEYVHHFHFSCEILDDAPGKTRNWSKSLHGNSSPGKSM